VAACPSSSADRSRSRTTSPYGAGSARGGPSRLVSRSEALV